MIKDLLKFEKAMKKKHYVLRGIDEAETMGDGSVRYIAWLKFPYYSDDSGSGFFSFFTEEDFDDYMNNSIHMFTEREIRNLETNDDFDPWHYAEFYEDNLEDEDEFNLKKALSLYYRERRRNSYSIFHTCYF